MTPLAIIRPQPAAARTAALAKEMGFDAHAYPMFELRGIDWRVPAGSYDAVLLSSANALRHGGEELAKLIDLPAYVVGERTAQQAQAAGFTIAATARDGVAELIGQIDPAHGCVLRLTGADRIEIEPPENLLLREVTLYESRPLPMPDDLSGILCGPSTVVLHSARAGEHLAAQCTALGIPRMHIALACLSTRIAESVGRGWRAVDVATETSDAALLETARALCHSLG